MLNNMLFIIAERLEIQYPVNSVADHLVYALIIGFLGNIFRVSRQKLQQYVTMRYDIIKQYKLIYGAIRI